MIRFFAKIFGLTMGILYSFFKRMKTENKIAFISRQSETPSLDFRYLTDEIRKEYPQYKIAVLCKMIPKGIFGKILYGFEMLRQMKAMATSKVVVLDGYCILACMLHHKKDLKIIQIWHALGSFKRFGKSILDMEGGNSSAVADAFKMHNNYDLIAASGDACVPHFAEAFGQPVHKFIPIGIPRMDYLTDDAETEKLNKAVYGAYPQLDNGRKNILYVPTFRDNGEDTEQLRTAEQALIKQIDYNKFNLIVKRHVVDGKKEYIYTDSAEQVISGERFTGMDFMAAADYVVTDYSSIIYEALLKKLPVYIYCFDSEKYIDERGFYIDFWKDIPAVYSKNAQGIAAAIQKHETADAEKTEQFKKAYVNKKYPSVTKEYGKLIDKLIRNTYDGRYNYKENGNE